ncbi:universal stress protein [uncultured Eudoraea sp.]|uniref:universal stress protein n=1 Tax=uncultured Eudoraea sp. TaxID=1035614 RepID=UPI002624CBDD|nr:universal stress protein [uncultured Eudoraea sp.]
MKKILLLTDFSNNAWNAIFTALKMHEHIHCHFFLLNTYEPSFANILGDKTKKRLGVIYESLEKNSGIELDKIMQYLAKNHANKNHTFEKRSFSSDFINAVKEIRIEEDIDLIVMGTKGATGAKEIFMGSNTVKLIKTINTCPILAVPSQHDFKDLSTILFPTAFTKPYSKYELNPLTELASVWKSKILICHIAQEFVLNDEQISNKEILIKRMGKIAHSFHNVEMQANIADSIGMFAKESDSDVIVLINYKHTFIENLTHEAVIKKVGFHSKIPLLVLPE